MATNCHKYSCSQKTNYQFVEKVSKVNVFGNVINGINYELNYWQLRYVLGQKYFYNVFDK
eukprot:Pgem_evm1s18195